MIQFKAITEDNFSEIVHMKRPEGETFVAANVYSLAQAWLFREAGDVYPFAICEGDRVVGFMMLEGFDRRRESGQGIWHRSAAADHPTSQGERQV